MGELGPVSQAVLDYVNDSFGYVEFFRVINAAARVTETSHSESWYFRRLVALALEGRIEATVRRDGDNVTIRFRRHQEGEV